MSYKPEQFCSKDGDGFNILEVGKLVKFDDYVHEILEIGPRSNWEATGVQLLCKGVLTKNMRTGQKEYFLEHDLI